MWVTASMRKSRRSSRPSRPRSSTGLRSARTTIEEPEATPAASPWNSAATARRSAAGEQRGRAAPAAMRLRTVNRLEASGARIALATSATSPSSVGRAGGGRGWGRHRGRRGGRGRHPGGSRPRRRAGRGSGSARGSLRDGTGRLPEVPQDLAQPCGLAADATDEGWRVPSAPPAGAAPSAGGSCRARDGPRARRSREPRRAPRSSGWPGAAAPRRRGWLPSPPAPGRRAPPREAGRSPPGPARGAAGRRKSRRRAATGARWPPASSGPHRQGRRRQRSRRRRLVGRERTPGSR